MKWLNGNKFHLGMIAGGILGICYAQGWIDEQWAATAASLITAWTGVAVRSAYAKGG